MLHTVYTPATHKSDLNAQKDEERELLVPCSHHTWFELIKYKAKNIYYFFLNNTDGRCPDPERILSVGTTLFAIVLRNAAGIILRPKIIS